MRILLTKLRHIGDVLLITPLFENLKAHYGEDCEIGVLINQGCEGIIQDHPLLSFYHLYPRAALASLGLWGRIRAEVALVREIRAHRYDIVISLTEGERSAFLALLSGAKRRVGFEPKKGWVKRIYHDYIPKQGMKHTVDSNLEALRVLGVEIKSKRVSLGALQEEGLPELPSEFVHIHPVSRWLFKCLDDSLVAQIIDRLWSERGLRSVITCSDDEEEKRRCERIASFAHSEPLLILGGLSLPKIAALNQKARFFIGVDTAIMHLSAANGTPTLAFFGPSGAFHWGPWDNECLESGYQRRSGIQTMGKHRVYQDSRECVPCGQDGCGGSKRSECLLEIPLESAWSVVSDFIHSLKPNNRALEGLCKGLV